MKKATALLLSASILSGVCVPSACAEGGLDKLDDKKVFVALFEGNRENKFLKKYGFEDRRTEFSLIGTCNIQGVAYVFAKNGTAYVGIIDVKKMVSMGGDDLYSLKGKLDNVSKIIVFKTTENWLDNNTIEEFSEKEKEEVRNFMNDKFEINETEFINKSYVEEIKNNYVNGAENCFEDKYYVMFHLEKENDGLIRETAGATESQAGNETTESQAEEKKEESTESQVEENKDETVGPQKEEKEESVQPQKEDKKEETTESKVEENKDVSVKPKREKTKSGWDKIVWGSFFGAGALAVLVTSYYVFKNEISQGCSWLKNQFICYKNKISNYFKNK